MAQAKRDQNFVTTLLATSNVDGVTPVNVYADPVTHRLLVDTSGGGGGGTVTTVSVATANGFAGSVANATTTPAITLSTTITGILQGNGTAISAITVGSGLNFAANTLTATTPNQVNVSNESDTTTTYVGFYIGATGAQTPRSNVNFTFDSTTAALSAGSYNTTVNSTPANGMYLPAANTLGFSVNSAAELQLTSTAFSPASDGGNSLGTTALGWQNLFSNTGFVWNIEGGNWVATHTSGILTIGTGELRIATPGTTSTSVPNISSTNTFTNKRITPRVTTLTTSTAPTVNTDDCDAVTITALAATITSMSSGLSGTPTNFQKLTYRIKDNGTARGITWGASFADYGGGLPTTTVLGKVLTVGFIYDTVAAVWGCVATVNQP